MSFCSGYVNTASNLEILAQLVPFMISWPNQDVQQMMLGQSATVATVPFRSFHSHGDSLRAGWLMENPIEMDDFGGTPHIYETSIGCPSGNMLKQWRKLQLRQRIGDVCLYAGLHRFPAVCDILLAEYREYLGRWTIGDELQMLVMDVTQARQLVRLFLWGQQICLVQKQHTYS